MYPPSNQPPNVPFNSAFDPNLSQEQAIPQQQKQRQEQVQQQPQEEQEKVQQQQQDQVQQQPQQQQQLFQQHFDFPQNSLIFHAMPWGNYATPNNPYPYVNYPPQPYPAYNYVRIPKEKENLLRHDDGNMVTVNRNGKNFTTEQVEQLEAQFKVGQNLTGENKKNFAKRVKLTERQVEVWFRNRRVKFRKQEGANVHELDGKDHGDGGDHAEDEDPDEGGELVLGL